MHEKWQNFLAFSPDGFAAAAAFASAVCIRSSQDRVIALPGSTGQPVHDGLSGCAWRARTAAAPRDFLRKKKKSRICSGFSFIFTEPRKESCLRQHAARDAGQRSAFASLYPILFKPRRFSAIPAISSAIAAAFAKSERQSQTTSFSRRNQVSWRFA